MLWLRIGREKFPLRQGETTLGRSHYCTIVIDSATASREHAAILTTGDEVVITDLQSRNGIAINGRKAKGPTRIEIGDVVTIGSQQIELVQNALSDDTANTIEGELPSDPRLATATLPDPDELNPERR